MGAETGQVAAAHLARLRWHELATASASASAAAAGYGHGAVDGDAHAHASEEGRNHHGADGSDSGADVVVASEAVLFDESAAEAVEMTAYEDFVTSRVRAGHSIRGLYPATDPNSLTLFAAWRQENGR